MILLGNKKKHWLCWTLLALAAVFLNVSLLASLRLSLDSIFSGLLALTGFVFASRTFITFKLNDVVYGNPSYRNYIEQLRKDGVVDKELYAPLRKLDSSLGDTTGMCLIALGLFAIIAFLPDFREITLDSTTKVSRLCELVFSVRNIKLAFKNPAVFFPIAVVFLSDMALLYFFFVLNQILQTMISLNKNIKAIIDHWEQDYKDNK